MTDRPPDQQPPQAPPPGGAAPAALLWLVMLVLAKGALLGLLGLGLCLSNIGGPPPPDGCRNVVAEIAATHGRTVELVLSLAAGAGLAARR